MLNPGDIFMFTGSIPNQKFVGTNVTLTVSGLPNATINTLCSSPAFVGNTYGSFTVVAGQSLNGGAICCAPSSIETISPVIENCPSDITVSAGHDACTESVAWSAPTASDNCELFSFTSTHDPGDIFQMGETEVVYTAIDIYGNTSLCTFHVTVKDQTAPTFSGCPADVTITLDESCEPSASWTPPEATDNCNVTTTNSHNPGDMFPIGTTEVKYIATDDAGNESICRFNVIVKNTKPLVIEGCPDDITVMTDSPEEVMVTWESPIASAKCVEVQLSTSHEPGSMFPIGVTDVEYEALDDFERSAKCSFKVNVIIDESVIEVSKAVTPNDDGINDVWTVKNIEKFSRNKVLIVDRFGREVYVASGYDNEKVVWKGVNRQGNVVPTGTYFYTLNVLLGKREVEKKGFIEVIQ
jgi:gliding motility-associated-like protein